jgi:hypothetical protein
LPGSENRFASLGWLKARLSDGQVNVSERVLSRMSREVASASH